MESDRKKIGRRSFFAGLGMVAGAGLAVKLMPKSAPVPEDTTSKAPQDGKYRLSEHIKKYYRTTSI
jgi:hypothetical protein